MSSGEQEALRLANALLEYGRVLGPGQTGIHGAGAAMLRRLVAEREVLLKQHLEAHNASAAVFDALMQISLITDLGGEVSEYVDVVDAEKRLHAEREADRALMREALEALTGLIKGAEDCVENEWGAGGAEWIIPQIEPARAAISKLKARIA